MRAPFDPAWIWLPPVLGLAALLLVAAGGANRTLFLLLNHGGHLLGAAFWLHLTMLGDGAIALALVLPCIRRAPRCFWAAVIAAVFAGLWTQFTKQCIDVPRPLAVFGAAEFFHAGPAHRQVSFPSGHAAAAFALAGIAVMGAAQRALTRWLALGLACLVGLSRIMVGVHWPIDVLWGMLGGWAGAWCGLALCGRLERTGAGAGTLAAGLVLLGLCAALLASRHIGIPSTLPLQRLIAGVCLVWGAWEIGAMPFPRHRRRAPGAAPVADVGPAPAAGRIADG